jgi:hypothetical protein
VNKYRACDVRPNRGPMDRIGYVACNGYTDERSCCDIDWTQYGRDTDIMIWWYIN